MRIPSMRTQTDMAFGRNDESLHPSTEAGA